MSNLTKKALLEALGVLLEKKPFSKITVGDLTEKCGLNRMTFYYHFQNIYELMIWGLETNVLEAARDCLTYENWKTGYLRLYQFALEHKVYITKIFMTIEEEHLGSYLNKIAEKMVLAVIDEKCRDVCLDEADKRFTAEVCAHALVGVLVSWVKRGMEEEPREVIRKLGCLLDGMVEKTMNGFRCTHHRAPYGLLPAP